MNKFVLGLLLGALVGGGAMWALRPHTDDKEAPKAAEAAKPAEEKPNPLRLPAAKREQAGIVLAKPASARSTLEVGGFARVIDVTPFAALLAEIETARGALQASEKEVDRARKLFAAGGNASAQAVEIAEAAVARDRAALTSARARLAATWGREIAQNIATLSAALEQGGSLVRIDLLAGDEAAASLKQARLTVPGTTQTYTADVLGPVPSADPQLQGTGFLALVHERTIPAGTALRAVLAGVGEPADVITIPRSAVVYHQGSAWIYVLDEEDTFERRLVSLGRPFGEGQIILLSGAETDHQIVATGAQQLLSAELQAGGPAEP
jgi:hypothetical protein